MTSLIISQIGINLIAEWEQFSATAFPDGGKGLYSIGYGTYIDTAAEKYLFSKSISKSEGMVLMKADISKQFEPAIKKWIKVQLTQNQHDALLSLLYNIGERCLGSRGVPSGLCNAINAQDDDRIKVKWAEWRIVTMTNGKKQVSNYLVERRAAELALWFESVVTKRDGSYTAVRRNNENGNTITNGKTNITWIVILLIMAGAGFWAYKKGKLMNVLNYIKDLRKSKKSNSTNNKQ